jgi:hypothetical protein
VTPPIIPMRIQHFSEDMLGIVLQNGNMKKEEEVKENTSNKCLKIKN